MQSVSKSAYSRLVKENDALIQRVSALTFNGRCAFDPVCGCGEGVAGHHIVRRAVIHLRHCPLNVIYVCQAHHDIFHLIRTDQNAKLFNQISPDGEPLCTFETTLNLLSMTPTLRPLLDFYGTHRLDKPQVVMQIHLQETRSQLKGIIKQLEVA